MQQKGENAISVALAAVLLLAIMAIHQRWQPVNLKEVASAAEDFLLTTAGLRGEVPEISGYEKVKTFRLGRYRAGLYRASPAPLVFAPGRLVVYDPDGKPAFKLETLEGSRNPWTALYDFAGRKGLSLGGRARPDYVRDLTASGDPDVVIGQYSGGDHCCTTVTVLELGKESVKTLGRIGGLDGLPFEGLEVRKVDKDPDWEFIAHRPYRTACGTHEDSPDLLSIYGLVNGQYIDQTSRHAEFLQGLLRQNLQKWSKEKDRTLQLLQSIAVDYAELGQREEGKRFFAMNLTPLLPELLKKGTEPNTCIEDVVSLLDRLTSVVP